VSHLCPALQHMESEFEWSIIDRWHHEPGFLAALEDRLRSLRFLFSLTSFFLVSYLLAAYFFFQLVPLPLNFSCTLASSRHLPSLFLPAVSPSSFTSSLHSSLLPTRFVCFVIASPLIPSVVPCSFPRALLLSPTSHPTPQGRPG